MSSESTLSPIANALLSIAVVILCILALNALWAFDYKRTANGKAAVFSSERIIQPSLLISEGTIQKRTIDSDIARLSEPLDFMVWPQQRKMASIKLQSVLQQRLNLNPFDLQAWRRLSFAQAYIDTPIDERIWTIATGLKLGGWHTSERILFTRHCVAENELFKSTLPEFCQRLIQALPNDIPTSRMARYMGVKPNYLKWLLLQSPYQAEGDTENLNPSEKVKQ